MSIAHFSLSGDRPQIDLQGPERAVFLSIKSAEERPKPHVAENTHKPYGRTARPRTDRIQMPHSRHVHMEYA
jgi:hypothetical protein